MRKRKHGKSQKKAYIKIIIIVSIAVISLLFLIQESKIKTNESKNNLMKTYGNINEIDNKEKIEWKYK